MPRRPLIITLITFCYFVSPIVILFHGAIINRVPLLGLNNIFARLYFADWIVLAAYPVCAIAIYSVKKWSWYLFLACSLYLILYNFIVYFLNPRYNLDRVLIKSAGLNILFYYNIVFDNEHIFVFIFKQYCL